MRRTNWLGPAISIPAFFVTRLAVGLAMIKLSAHFLTVADFGVFSQFLLFSALANTLASAGVQSGLIREVAAAGDDIAKRSAVRAALTIWVAVGLTMTCLVLSLARYASVLLCGTASYAWLARCLVVAAIGGGPGQIYGAVLTGSGRGGMSLAAQGAGLVAGGAGALWLLASGHASTAVLAFSVGPLATSLFSWIFARRARILPPGAVSALRDHTFRLLSYASSFVATASFMPMTLFGLRYLYRESFGVRDLGYWLAANRISDVTTSLLGLFMTQVLLRAMATAPSEAAARKIAVRVFLGGTAAMATILLAFWSLSGPLIRIFLSARYLTATPYILGYMTGDVLRVSVSIALYTALSSRKLKFYIGIELAFAIVFGCVGAFLIFDHNAMGPVAAYICCNGFVAVLAWTYFLRGRRPPRAIEPPGEPRRVIEGASGAPP